MNYTNITDLLFGNRFNLNNYSYKYFGKFLNTNNTANNENMSLKKYMLDSTYKSINKYLLEKDYVQGFNIYTGYYNNYNKSNVFALLMGILGFTVTYRYLRL